MSSSSSSLSVSQERALFLLPKVTGFSSVLFSFFIARLILRDKSKRKKVYHRLILGMSLADISSSIWFAMSTWPIPASSDILWAVGNTASCNFQGFFIQFGIASPLYNASLSFCYLLSIRYGWKEQRLRKMEPLWHLLPVGWALGTALAGLLLQIFNSATLWCWIADLPGRRENTDVFRLTFFYGPLWLTMVSITVNLVLVFLYVRKATLQSEKYILEQSTPSTDNNDEYENDNDDDHDDDDDDDDHSHGHGFIFSKRVMQQPPPTQSPAGKEIPKIPKSSGGSTVSLTYMMIDAAGSLTPSKNNYNQKHGKSPSKHSHTSTSSDNNRDHHHNPNHHHQHYQPEQQPPIINALVVRRRRQVPLQCLRYALAFYWTWIPISVVRLLQRMGVEPPFVLLLLAAMNTPMQGLPNFIVYLYPMVQKKKRQHPSKNIVQCIHLSITPSSIFHNKMKNLMNHNHNHHHQNNHDDHHVTVNDKQQQQQQQLSLEVGNNNHEQHHHHCIPDVVFQTAPGIDKHKDDNNNVNAFPHIDITHGSEPSSSLPSIADQGPTTKKQNNETRVKLASSFNTEEWV